MIDMLRRNDAISSGLAVAGVVAIAGLLSLVGVVTFVRSSAYDTVRQLHNATLDAPVDLGDGIDTTSPVKASDVDAFGDAIEKRANSFDDNYDFGLGEIREQEIGF